MKIIRPLFALLSILLIQVVAFGQDDSRTIQTWNVQKYDMSVNFPTEERNRNISITAILNVQNVSGKPVSSLTLRISPQASVSTIRINGTETDFSKAVESIGAAGTLQRLAVRFASVAPGAVLTAIVDYKLDFKDNSGLATLSSSGSQLLPMSFWYPTPTSWFFTRGGDFAPFSIKANGLGGQTLISAGSRTGEAFEQKVDGRPFLVTGNWDNVEINGVSVSMPKGVSADGRKRGAELASLFADARAYVAGIFGAGPETPLRVVSVRRGGGFGSGGTILVDEAVFRRSKIDSQTAMSIAEAAVKCWIGESITVNGDAYGIIQEGMVRYIATQFLEKKYGKDVADIERLRQRTAYSTVSKRDVALTRVAQLDDFYFTETANKGAMAWRLIEKRVGSEEFARTLKANMQDGDLNVAELRMAFSQTKDLIDYLFDQSTEMNLLAGLPQRGDGETKVALRNTGAIAATANVTATLANGQTMEAPTTVRALSFGEVVFKTGSTISRIEIDPEKLYPQTEYSDDVAPRETTESDLLLSVKKHFDKRDYAATERAANLVLATRPRFDDVRVLLGRALLELNRIADAEREFRLVLDEKLPSSRSLAWAYVGLSEAASKQNRNDEALKFAEAAILADAEYGAGLAARNIRAKLNSSPATDPGVKSFFAEFDKAAASNRKADLDVLVVPGEVTRFAGGISGSTELWQTQVRQVDYLDANTVVVETNMTVRLLTKETETGMAVYRLFKIGGVWKLGAVDIFEVR